MNSIGQVDSSVERRHAVELAAMRRLLVASAGTFSLSVAICNSPRLRDQLLHLLVNDEPNIRIIRIPQGVKDVFSFVKELDTQTEAAALMLVGLEGSIPAGEGESDDRFLRSLNATRELWKESFSCPVVLWLPEYAVALLSTKARDLWAWRSHQFEFVVGYERLPADPPDFQGREKETESLVQWLTSSEPYVAIFGMAGVGKSALAIRVAHRLSAEFPDGRIYIDMSGPTGELSARDAIYRILRVFDNDVRVPQDVSGARIMYEEFVSQRKILTVLDDVREESQVLPLTLTGGGSALLVVSQVLLDLPRFHHLTLGPLSSESAIRLVRQQVGIDRVSADEAARIAEISGRSPLSLKLVGGFLKAHPDWGVTKYLDALQDVESHVWKQAKAETGTGDFDDSLKRGVAISLLSQNALSRSWQMLSVFPESFDVVGAAAVWGISERAARSQLRELDARGLVQREVPTQRYRLQGFARRVALDPRWSPPDTDPDEVRETLSTASRRHAAYYLEILQDHINGGVDSGQRDSETSKTATENFIQEVPNIVAGQLWSASHWQDAQEAAEYCVHYAYAVPALRQMGMTADVATSWLRAGVAAAGRRENRKAQVELLTMLGDSLDETGKEDERIQAYEQAWALTDPDDERLQVLIPYKLGLSLARAGRLDEARPWIERSIDTARPSGWVELEAYGRHYLGWIALRQGKPEQALPDLEAARETFARLGTRDNELAVLTDIAWAHAQLGKTDIAIDALHRALKMAYGLSNPVAEVDVLQQLGTVYGQTGQPRQAIEWFEQALRVSRGIGDRRREGQLLMELGASLLELGQLEKASEYFRRVVSLAEEINESQLQQSGLRALARVLFSQARYDEGRAALERALQLAEAIGDPLAEAETRIAMAVLFENQGLAEQRNDMLTRALKLVTDSDSPVARDLKHYIEQLQARSAIGEDRRTEADASETSS